MAVFRDPDLPKKPSLAICDLDGDGRRYGLIRDGLIIFVGSDQACHNRTVLLTKPETRDLQDAAVGRL